MLAEVAGEVYALELLAPLAERARAVLARLGYQNTHTAIADGAGGWPEMAPFDAVLVAAAAPQAPPALLRQLRDGGRLVIPLGHPHRDQVLTVFQRVGDEYRERRDTRCRFVPLVSAGTSPGAPPIPLPVKRATDEEVAVMKAVAVRVSGTVQGVYYRASARHEGERLGVRGWVKNARRRHGHPASPGRPCRRGRHARLVQGGPAGGAREPRRGRRRRARRIPLCVSR